MEPSRLPLSIIAKASARCRAGKRPLITFIVASAYPSYLSDWRNFTNTILASVPTAKFAGPFTGAYTTLTYTPDPASGVSWTRQFVHDEKNSGILADAAQHHYIGAGPKNTTSQQAMTTCCRQHGSTILQKVRNLQGQTVQRLTLLIRGFTTTILPPWWRMESLIE